VPSFGDLGVPADLLAVLHRRGITDPFPVQVATIPDALTGTDVCGKAPTGSGKTLAFGIPLVMRVPPARPRRPRALVLAPTRELAAQIQSELEPLAAARDTRVFSVYGGVGYEKQKKALRRGVEILVACPGRLRDLVAQRAVRLDAVEIVVIDEADRMADMGFLPEVRGILEETSPKRQTVLFSATLDGDVAVLQHQYQREDAVTYEIADPAATADIEHHFEELEANERVRRAAEIVRAHGSTIVFTRTRHAAERVAKQLRTAGVDAAAIHGGLSQSKRDRALAGFRQDRVEALIATDVAARGIHVDAVACVVHFDPPADAKTYVHRSGRTARAGATGTVVSFVARNQRSASRRLRQELGLLPRTTNRDQRAPDRRARDARNKSHRRRRGSGNGQTRVRHADSA
jgi:superfamily II DNA/RNA helicase